MDLDKLVRPHWKVGEIIRHKNTGNPFRVIHIYKYVSTILVDLTDNAPLPPTLMLLPRNYDDYAVDSDMEFRNDKWEFNQVAI